MDYVKYQVTRLYTFPSEHKWRCELSSKMILRKISFESLHEKVVLLVW